LTIALEMEFSRHHRDSP